MSRRYTNPPVEEALCEILFANSAWDPTVPGLFYDRIRQRFPDRAQVPQGELELELAERQATARVMQVEPRMQFRRADEAMIVQLQRDLLVVNQLRPYPRFEEWRPVVLEMLALYQELAQPESIERLAVRYINRVIIPQQQPDVETYFRIYPRLPDELNPHGDFLVRVQVPAPRREHQLFVTFVAAPAQPNQSVYLLDLFDNVPLGTPEAFALAEQRLDEAHANIVMAFESAITDQARTMFGEVQDDRD